MQVIKHPPSRKRQAVHLSTRTPLMSALKRVCKGVDLKKEVKVVGSGRAIQKVLCLVLKLQKEGYECRVSTSSLVVQDETVTDESAETKERTISAVEVVVRKA